MLFTIGEELYIVFYLVFLKVLKYSGSTRYV